MDGWLADMALTDSIPSTITLVVRVDGQAGWQACQVRLERACACVRLWVGARLPGGWMAEVVHSYRPVQCEGSGMAGRARKMGAVQDDVRIAVAAPRRQASSTQASLEPVLHMHVSSPPSSRLPAASLRALRPQRRLTRPRMALAPDILASAAIRYRHGGCTKHCEWMFARCGQQTVFGLLLPLRCICHTC